MNNLEDALRETIYSKDATFFTGISKEIDFNAVLQMITFTESESIANRIISEENPLRFWSLMGSTFIIGHTERLKTDADYFEKFIKMSKLMDLDKDFIFSYLGNRLNVLKKEKKFRKK